MKKKLNRKEFIGIGMAFAASGCSTWNGGFPAITAERLPGTKLAWDPKRRAFDCAAANAFLNSSYRKGWEVEGLS